MEPRRDVDVASELRMLRPTPRQEFAAALDARAAAGFPPDPERAGSPLARFGSRLRALSTRRLLAPAGGFAATAIVVATAAVAISTSGTSDTSPQQVTTTASGTATSKRAAEAAASAPSAAAAELSSPLPPGDAGPFASRAGRRSVERSAQIVLGAEPSEIRDVSDKVFETVQRYDGIVLSSSIADGTGSDAGAEFDLLIPSGKLGDALAAFSGIAEVRSRQESSQDITAPTVSVEERLQDSRARIEGLLDQLAAADSDGERVAAEAELRSEREHAAALRSRLSSLERRANLSHVTLRIETGDASASGTGGGPWGVDDALTDAGRILAIAAGVTLVGLAIVGPLALIALLAWLTHRTWVRGRRAQALR